MALALAGCRGDASSAAVERANPASEYCVVNGGRLAIETAGDGGQYGVCLFEDNRQCEEWALLRGACPVGGIRITGYATPQARYCAIRGGGYVVTRQETSTTPEAGTCTLPGQPTCDALALYDGRCPDRSAGTRAQGRTSSRRGAAVGPIGRASADAGLTRPNRFRSADCVARMAAVSCWPGDSERQPDGHRGGGRSAGCPAVR
ncbi:MAG: putative hemolysin [Geminicoccaceae bacterium]